jgi:catechol 2,3-dioxygenase-like lactoylglutathione lyase family enzyme
VERPRLRLSATVLHAADPNVLGAFYARLLDWPVVEDSPGWVRVRPPDGGPGLSFHDEPAYVPPVWPSAPGQQQLMLHLDVRADDLEAAVAWAVEAGATVAGHQPQRHVRVLLDPAGHPFCLFAGSG